MRRDCCNRIVLGPLGDVFFSLEFLVTSVFTIMEFRISYEIICYCFFHCISRWLKNKYEITDFFFVFAIQKKKRQTSSILKLWQQKHKFGQSSSDSPKETCLEPPCCKKCQIKVPVKIQIRGPLKALNDTKLIYRTGAMITLVLYILYPLFEVQKRFFNGLFS